MRKMYCRTIGELMGWECEDRSAETLKKMLAPVATAKSPHFFADRWEAYAELISPEFLIQSKAETHGVERSNFRQRH